MQRSWPSVLEQVDAVSAVQRSWPSLPTHYASQPSPKRTVLEKSHQMPLAESATSDHDLRLPDWRGPLKSTVSKVASAPGKEDW